DHQTGEPIADATLLLMEDAAVTPVTTDAEGHYNLTAYEGDYTLRVIKPSYHNNNVSINIDGNDDTTQNIKLKPFINGPSEELAYDDGIAEGHRAFFDADNGWAVKMSLKKGEDSALVTGGKFLFSEDFPVHAGNDFKIEIWDSNGKNGSPGTKLLG